MAEETNIKTPQSEAVDPASAGSRHWEDRYYNSYGNYDGFRFGNFQDRCPMLKKHCGFWECTHPQRDTDFGGHCCLHGCPSVEVNGDSERFEDWSDSEVPVLVLDTEISAHMAKLWPAENADGLGRRTLDADSK